MGYMDAEDITVDAVLTKRGRELMGKGNFSVSQWALSDDGVDYRLWDPGQDYTNSIDRRGHALQDMPILEPSTSGMRQLRNKLLNLDNLLTDPQYGTTGHPRASIPVMGLRNRFANKLNSTITGIGYNVTSHLLSSANIQNQTTDIELCIDPRRIDPSTNTTTDSKLGYTAIIRDASLFSIRGSDGPVSPGMVDFTFDTYNNSIYRIPKMGKLNGKTTAIASGNWFVINRLPTTMTQAQLNTLTSGTFKLHTELFIYDNETGSEVIIRMTNYFIQ